MSNQVSLQKMKIGQNSIYALFARRPSIVLLLQVLLVDVFILINIINNRLTPRLNLVWGKKLLLPSLKWKCKKKRDMCSVYIHVWQLSITMTCHALSNQVWANTKLMLLLPKASLKQIFKRRSTAYSKYSFIELIQKQKQTKKGRWKLIKKNPIWYFTSKNT